MAEWRFRDSIGILIVLGLTVSVARSLEGIAQAIVALVGAVIVFLWIGYFVLEGYNDASRDATRET